MTLKQRWILFAGSLFLMSAWQSAYAECTTTRGELSFNRSTMFSPISYTPSKGVYWPVIPPPAQLKGASLVNCSNLMPNSTTTAKSSMFRPGDGNNIDLNRSRTISGKTYYKIINSTNNFVDQHGYISFQVQDSRTGAAIKEISPTITLDNRVPKAASNQGISIRNLELFFDEVPYFQFIVSNLSLGKLYLTLESATAETVRGQEDAYISFNYTAPPIITCNITSHTVNLPTVLNSALKNKDDEAGYTKFSITANCLREAVGKPLQGKMLDSTTPNNSSFILSNANKQSNIGLSIYDAVTQQPMRLNDSFLYGISHDPAMYNVIRNFYVRYRKIDSNPTVAGPVNGQITISVGYK